MKRSSRARNLVLAVALVGCALAASASAYVPTGTERIALTIKHSRFSRDVIHVERGQRVRFVVSNTDPIDHELIVGPMDVHRRHELGTEPRHGARDGEVSVKLFGRATTSYTFEHDGTYYFGCHLPQHWGYGMRGRVIVG